ILVLQRGPLGDPSQTQGACFFSNKVETAQLLGYDAVIIANHHTGALGGAGPDTYLCGSQGHEFDVQISAVCVGHRAMHELFDAPAGYAYPEAVPAIGTVGDKINVTTQFDGWGYVHLYDAATGQDLDTFAIPEAMDPAFASGFGDLSVHEVATDPTDPSLMYLSYYSGGLRALQIQCTNPADNTTCELVEVGGYLDEAGNNFWGVEVIPDPANPGEVLILASDRDYGLFIFRDP
ncbi:MAG: PA domain-containing protein, partial [Acidimicrobiales bacterium]